MILLKIPLSLGDEKHYPLFTKVEMHSPPTMFFKHMLFKYSAFFPPIQALYMLQIGLRFAVFDYSFIRYFLNGLPNTLLQTVENRNYLYTSFLNEFIHWQY